MPFTIILNLCVVQEFHVSNETDFDIDPDYGEDNLCDIDIATYKISKESQTHYECHICAT